MSLDDTLTFIEAQLQDMQAALLASNPQTFEDTAVQLRGAAMALAQALAPVAGALEPAATQRVQAIGRQLTPGARPTGAGDGADRATGGVAAAAGGGGDLWALVRRRGGADLPGTGVTFSPNCWLRLMG